MQISVAEPVRRQTTETTDAAEEHPLSRFVPLAVALGCILTLLIIPFRIVGYGYLPGDDALRHAAKAVSDRPWSDILVLKEQFRNDHHPGWHWILGQAHRATGAGTEGLVTGTVLTLFLGFALVPLLRLRRPESWVAALVMASLAFPGLIARAFLGRPYVLTMIGTMAILMIWRKPDEGRPSAAKLAVTTLLIALSAWMHGTWYLFAVVVLAFALARWWTSAAWIAGCWLTGSLLAGVLSGRPIEFLSTAVTTAVSCFGNHQLQRMLVTEFLPSGGDGLAILAIVALILARRMGGDWNWKHLDNPIFILGIIGWVLGLRVLRFWQDWGLLAFALWAAYEFQHHFERHLAYESLRRLVIAGALCIALFSNVTSDLNGRWTNHLTNEYLDEKDPEMRPWLPDENGIFYSADMYLFYQTFFKNPHARWRYILGFEPSFMPDEDLKILRRIQWNYYSFPGYEPWARKMTPADRLVIRNASPTPPNIGGLEWKYAAREIWIGRVPRVATSKEITTEPGPAPIVSSLAPSP